MGFTKCDVRKHHRGFTLIELLVVIAIIGLLASIVLVGLNSVRAKSRDARRLSDLEQFQKALELCYDKQGSYFIHGETKGTSPCSRERFQDADFVNGWKTRCGEFMDAPPADPKDNIYYTIHTTGDLSSGYYQHYVLLAQLETDTYTITSEEVVAFVRSVGITDWTPCSSFNYVIGH